MDTGWPPAGWNSELRRRIAGWLGHCDYLLLNEVETLGLADNGNLAAAGHALARQLAPGGACVIKCGNQGAMVCDGLGVISCAADPVQVVDTIGAGDSFNAGFLSALLYGYNRRQALYWGTRVAGRAISSSPRQYPDRASLQSFAGEGVIHGERRISQSRQALWQTYRAASVGPENSGRQFYRIGGPFRLWQITLLRLLAGLDTVSDGDIFIDRQQINNLDPADRDIAMVFQSYALYPHLSVAENLAFHMQVKKVPRQEQQTKVQQVARMLGIEPLLQRLPKALSGGQRQRVAMGRAMVRNPRVFLFDEPLSNLDAQLRMELRAEIKSLHQQLKTTTVYVTHDQVEAMTLADQIVVMKEGSIVQQGQPLEIYDRPVNTFVARFIGSPPMNLLEGLLEPHDGVAWREMW